MYLLMQELFAASTEFLWEALAGLPPPALTDVAVAYAAVQHYDDDEHFFDKLADVAHQSIAVRNSSHTHTHTQHTHTHTHTHAASSTRCS